MPRPIRRAGTGTEKTEGGGRSPGPVTPQPHFPESHGGLSAMSLGRAGLEGSGRTLITWITWGGSKCTKPLHNSWNSLPEMMSQASEGQRGEG